MSRYELSISPDYVPDWGLVEGVREIFQNALDHGKMSWHYNPALKELSIENSDIGLEINSLLLGTTTKKESPNKIGQFGEGYKLALLALTRANYSCLVHNQKKNELWSPKIINSRRFQSKLLIINVTKQKTTSKNLIFTISNITEKDFKKLKNTNLHINPVENISSTPFGDIIFDPAYAGRIFVKGLHVCDLKEFKYGYDIKPAYLTIGRDRNLVGSFDLRWVTSKMWASVQKPGLISEMIDKKFSDIAYLDSFSTNEIINTLYAEFVGNYGKLAIPVSNQSEYDLIKKSYKKLKPVIVKEQLKTIIVSKTNDVLYKATKRHDERLPKEILEDFKKKIKNKLDRQEINEFDRIIKKANQWTLI